MRIHVQLLMRNGFGFSRIDSPLCWFESILMLARNDMINEGSRTNRVTGAR
jgi:hypothetical protein